MSVLISVALGNVSNPKRLNKELQNIAVLTAFATACGAKNKPSKISRFCSKEQPTSRPIPGDVNLLAQSSIKSLLPAIYPPVRAIPPPGFLIKDPTQRSAPTQHGSKVSTNSP